MYFSMLMLILYKHRAPQDAGDKAKEQFKREAESSKIKEMAAEDAPKYAM